MSNFFSLCFFGIIPGTIKVDNNLCCGPFLIFSALLAAAAAATTTAAAAAAAAAVTTPTPTPTAVAYSTPAQRQPMHNVHAHIQCVVVF